VFHLNFGPRKYEEEYIWETKKGACRGYSSRAVIKKGTLSLISKSTIAGHVAYILDEDRNICSGEKTGIWYDGNYFAADHEKGGRIIIPYEKY